MPLRSPLRLLPLLIFLTVTLFACTPTHTTLPKNQTLTVALESKVPSTDPRLVGTDANSQYLEILRFLPLVGADPSGNPTYIAAQSIDLAPNGLSITVTLKPQLTLANGQRTLHAQDVVATYQALLTPKEGFPPSPRRAAFQNIKTIQATAPNTVVFELKQPDSAFLTNLVVGLLPEEAVGLPSAKLQGQGFESGPFVLQTVNDQQVILTPNSHYGLGPVPKIPYIQFLVLPDAGTRFAALLKGDVDLAQNGLDPDKVQEIRKERAQKFQVLTGSRLSTTYIGINFRDPQLQDIRVRRALAHALPIHDVIRYRLQDLATPAESMFPQGFYYHDDSLAKISYNPHQARALLEDFSQQTKTPLPLSLSLKVSSSTRSNVDAANILSLALNAVGFEIRVEPLENSLFFNDLRKGLSDLWLATWVGFKDPDHLRFVFSSQMTPPQGANRGAYRNTELDPFFTQAQITVQPQKRKKLYDKIQGVLAQEVAYVYLWHIQNIAVVNKRVQGYHLYADGRYAALAEATLIEPSKDKQP